MGRGMLYLGAALMLGVLTAFFNVLVDQRNNPNQQLRGDWGDGYREVRLKRNAAGHYVASGRINGQPVTFLLDTGATAVAVPRPLAERLGLPTGPEISVQTANGTARGWLTRIPRVELGPIRMESVRGTISEGMEGDQVLLGMTFLKHLQLRQQGDELLLRQATGATP